jgi:predicted RNA-binding Zn ribbon-like protein
MSNEFIAGRPCLDFANTVDWRVSAAPEELLHDYDGLLAWSVRAGTLGRKAAQRLERVAHADPDDAAEAFARARELREAIYRTFRAHARNDAPAADDLALVARSYAESIEHAELAPAGSKGYVWTFEERDDGLDRPWWPIALSAVELLGSGELARVRECEGRGCGWLFLDESRNHGRRWCVSSSCGNRERVRRYYARQTSGERRKAGSAARRGRT